MFKIFFLGMAALGAAGCVSAPRLPPVNLQQPGWTVHEGKAVWTKKRGAMGVAGEILLATRTDGRTFVQFSKTPFPLLTAQSTPTSWQVEVPAQNRRYAGRGRPPGRLIFLWLARVLEGEAPPKGWSWHSDQQGWRLENPRTGEQIEGYFSP